MKKIITFFVILVATLALVTVSTYASEAVTFKALVNKNELAAGEKVMYKFTAENIQLEKGLNVVSAFLDYNRDQFETVQVTDFTSGEGWEPMIYNPETGELALSRSDEKGTMENNTLFIVGLTAKGNASLGEVSVGLKDVTIVEEERVTQVDGVSKAVKITETSSSNNNGGNSESGINPVYIIIVIVLGIVIILIIAFARGGKKNKKKSINTQNVKKF